jgi:hypothetical protein
LRALIKKGSFLVAGFKVFSEKVGKTFQGLEYLG